ncbi:heavy metal translocating P-type ATPase [Bacillus pseudomycoides]|uniref:Heavy metal translocating P-type ATPase n=2 Tax=Bacillus pseudomycoides TaxID=64104 RepID=A0A2B6RSE3_9BACI|nr:heavy metal translocating P-type ATPase [Bacillus pseudomycoides]PDY48671.1 heavy metal translocating P-type ATPase [Bacillus pseudomycoides]PEA84430.1 heavy metal translocating P-type ATPase [Bacillus pseudomycoides]PED74029.1 heavy metal translocating P-type ATPase [Bacillus pseudomycoides]PEJ80426.1 heavy metal translocating P-type ATPase [Bacillus pseudomycoides]PEM22661.1 heavy metal translocating P-type ATPase [Bacillus pseudomycoides]
MNSEVKTLPSKKNMSNPSWIQSFQKHYELIFAILSGVFILSGWLFTKNEATTAGIVFYILAYIIGGYAKAKEGIEDTIEEKELNVEMLMLFAAIGAAIIGYWAEGAILIFIFALSGAMEAYTLSKSQKEISALLDLQPEEALLISHGTEERIPVAQLEIDDIILIKPGERVPADGTIHSGETNIDEAAITGEPIPNEKKFGDEVFAGTVNLRGAIEVKITKRSDQTLFQKIIRLVQNAQSEKSPSQLFIEKFEGTYVKGVLIIVALMMFVPHFLLDWSWNETFYRAMILLVVASPCALVASITPATLSAISNGARSGILFKGGIHLERLASVKAIAFDKTGTLTQGKPTVTDVYVRDEITEKDVLYITASIESHSTHPLAEAIVKYAKHAYDITLTKPESVEDVTGFGLKGVLENTAYKIGKADFIGEETKTFHNGIATTLEQEGKTVVYISNEKGILGLIALKDTLRLETIAAIRDLQSIGVEAIMITGDNEQTAKAIATESNIKEYYASCLPETKVETVKQLKEKYGTVAMVGDGINDAPALATASIGVAMGEGTDVALETADVVLMKNELSRLAQAIRLSKRMNRIVKQNVIFSLAVIAMLICSNFLQFLALPFGVISHEGSTILVILNGLRLLKGNN